MARGRGRLRQCIDCWPVMRVMRTFRSLARFFRDFLSNLRSAAVWTKPESTNQVSRLVLVAFAAARAVHDDLGSAHRGFDPVSPCHISFISRVTCMTLSSERM
jgi:hypothetical protein